MVRLSYYRQEYVVDADVDVSLVSGPAESGFWLTSFAFQCPGGGLAESRYPYVRYIERLAGRYHKLRRQLLQARLGLLPQDS